MSEKQLPEEQMLFNEQYLVVKKIGQGGFGIVWEAYDFSLKNFVAIKELLKDYSETKFIEMFYKEALIAKNLIHDNVVRVQHFWRGDSDSYYIVMDYVVGNDLGYLLKKCSEKNVKLPWELAVFICGSVLKALDYANRLAKDITTGKPYGIVYRDVSPGNIMIFFDGSVKVSDFGIAKTAEELSRKTKQRIITGKYAYMSPEQVRGDSDVDCRSDIFSTGIVLYEMLSGLPLFKGTTEMVRRLVQESKINLTPLKDLNIPDELIDVVQKAMSKDRDKRYQNALEMFRDLRRLLKFKETEELSSELASFVSNILSDELNAENGLLEQVRQLNVQQVKDNPDVRKIKCRDFIMGDQSQDSEDGAFQLLPAAETDKKNQKLNETAVEPKKEKVLTGDMPEHKEVKAEERGKTVFEEVGDWLARKYKIYKKRVIRFTIALAITSVLFVAVDTVMQITELGKTIYAHLYPPDVIITTVPGGARVSMQTRDGKYIVSNADSEYPIELRKIAPQSYIVTAEKEGYKLYERIVRIEDKEKGADFPQKINIVFEFVLNINSDPAGAEVFIDASKFGTTPWKGELVAGAHTVKLVSEGFESLGSDAKETREGQCSLDFTRSTDKEVFSGIDPQYWAYNSTRLEGVKAFTLTGTMYKRFSVDSSPRGLSVYVSGEDQKRGLTPLTLLLKAGEYVLRLRDPGGKYEEITKTLIVEKSTNAAIYAAMNKLINFNVVVKDDPSRILDATLKIVSGNTIISKNISSDKPLQLALRKGKYKVIFSAGNEFKDLVFKEINTDEVDTVGGMLEYNDAKLKVIVREAATEKPIGDAFIWMHGQIAGRTDSTGFWENNIKFGTAVVRIVAKGFIEKSIDINLQPDKREGHSLNVSLQPEAPIELSIPVSTPTVKAGAGSAQKEKLPVQNSVRTEDTSERSKALVVCPNCKKEYPAGSRKLRFCINCGKLLKWE